jgi:hypothetical protein
MFAGRYRYEPADAKLDRLEALVVTQYARPLADVRFVASILSISCEQRYGALPMTPQKHKDETLRTLVDLTEVIKRMQENQNALKAANLGTCRSRSGRCNCCPSVICTRRKRIGLERPD